MRIASVLMLVVVFVLIVVSVLMIKNDVNSRKAECKSKGGTYLQQDHVCLKQESIPLTGD